MARLTISDYTIVRHPQTRIRFAQLPSGKLVPNQGEMPADPHSWTDEDIEANYRLFLRRNPFGR